MGEKQTLLERPENLITITFIRQNVYGQSSSTSDSVCHFVFLSASVNAYFNPDSFGPPALSPGGVRTSQPERADVEASIFLM